MRMKKILCYITLVFAIGGFISESMHNFMNLKLIYYNLYPERFYEKEKLYIYKKEENNSSSSSGANSWYFGVLDKQKTKDNIYYNTDYLRENLSFDNKGEYLKVWFCKNVNKTILRKTDKLNSTMYIKGIIIYAIILMIIPCLIYLIKRHKK